MESRADSSKSFYMLIAIESHFSVIYQSWWPKHTECRWCNMVGTTWLVFGCCRVFSEFSKGLIICEWGFWRKCHVSFLVKLDIIYLFFAHHSGGTKLMPNIVPKKPWTHISVDFITKLLLAQGYNSILVVCNRMTKMAHFVCHKLHLVISPPILWRFPWSQSQLKSLKKTFWLIPVMSWGNQWWLRY